MDKNTKLWLAAHDLLIMNPNSEVLCPECKIGALKLKEEQVRPDKIDRNLWCVSCGQHNEFSIVTVTISEEVQEEDYEEDPLD